MSVNNSVSQSPGSRLTSLSLGPAATMETWENLSDDSLISQVEKLEQDVKYLEIENEIFESYLSQNEPNLLAGYRQLVRYLTEPQDTIPLSSAMHSTTASSSRMNLSVSFSGLLIRKSTATTDSKVFHSTEKPLKINVNTKLDLAVQELESQQNKFKKVLNASHRKKFNLKVELNELKIRKEETEETAQNFENVMFRRNAPNEKVPAERFIKFMEEWLKKADVTIGKMRLRIINLNNQYRKIKYVIAQKEYLGETVHSVDFDKIRIENKYLQEKVEQKSKHLLELKQVNGEANLILSNFKNLLQKEIEELNKIIKQIQVTENKTIEIRERIKLAEIDVEKEEEILEKILRVSEHYTVPEVITYVRSKAKLQELKKNYKTWMRKNSIEKYTLNQCIIIMKNLTGSTKQRKSWFSIKSSISEISFPLIEQDDEQRNQEQNIKIVTN